MNKNYPKILIIGQAFHSNSGGGITLSNLFKDWPKERIANLVDFIPFSNDDYNDINTFELACYKKIFRVFTVNKFKKNSKKQVSETTSDINSINNKIKKNVLKILSFTGLSHIIYSYTLKKDFWEWIRLFNPDIVYTQLSSRDSIKLAEQIHQKLNKKLAIHIMDDWPSTIGSDSMFSRFWNKKINFEFKELLDKASIFLSISEGMAIEYEKRYNKKFNAFHNPIDIYDWFDLKLNPKDSKITRILHAGRIGLGISSSLLTVVKVLQDIKDDGAEVELIFQSSNIDTDFRNKISKYSIVKINNPVDYSEIPKILKNSDILLLSNDFDSLGKDFLKYSMPTKASEYMISKVPILVFSDKNSEVARSAVRHGWAFVVDQNNEVILKNAIIRLIKEKKLREKLSKKSFQYAMDHFDSKKVREDFRKILCS